jgi:CDP-glucose 4,6-dehydratase
LEKNNSFLKSYKNLRVLITGTSGFKGAWLAYWLKILGSKVYGISLKPEKDSILFKSLQLNKKIDQHFSDITNFDKLNCLVKKIKPDIIFHLAAQSIVSKSFIKPGETFRTNILGSANILETFRLNKIPYLVYITSDKCYLNLDSKKSYKENDTLGGLDNYSSSKASAELIFSSYFNSYFKNNKNLTVASARAGNVIGGGDMKENRIVPDIIKSIIQNKTLNLRNPRATRPWQHVLEPLSGYLLLGHRLLNKNLNTKITPSWNFGPKVKNCKDVSLITQLVLENWNMKNFKLRTDKVSKYYESKFLSLNIKKAKKELNWKPRLNLKETVKFTVDWYKNYFENKSVQKFTENQIQSFLEK